MEKTFIPNRLNFQQGLERIDKAVHAAGFRPDSQVWTSKDNAVMNVLKKLEVTNVPAGFEKYQLPFHLEGAQLFISKSKSGSKVEKHSHDGDGIRFIISGKLKYKDQILESGDWMFIPKGINYEFEVTEDLMACYCYCCCCA
jgi:hypothetical protein